MKEKTKVHWLRLLPLMPFFLVVGFLAAVLLLKPSGKVSEEENRALAQKPKLSGTALLSGDYQRGYEEWLSDQFPVRGGLVRAKTILGMALGQREQGGVWLGRGDYLIERYREEDFDRERIGENITSLAGYLGEMAGTLGEAHVQTLFVPSKANVLTDRLPAFAPVYDSGWLAAEVNRVLSENLGIKRRLALDLEETLAAHRDEPIYYRTDHHWTTLGAFYTYRRYRLLRGEKAPEAEDYRKTTVAEDFYGTSFDKLQVKLRGDKIERWDPATVLGEAADRDRIPGLVVEFDGGKKRWETFYDASALRRKDKYQYFLGGNAGLIHIRSGAANDRCLLLLKDSYSNCLAEFLAADFADIYMVDLRYMSRNIHDVTEEIGRENRITDLLAVYNREKFMKDNNLSQLEAPARKPAEDDADTETEDPEELEDTEEGSIFYSKRIK